jgi:uncharacterized membrane protein YraQ (UPF0718 family)
VRVRSRPVKPNVIGAPSAGHCGVFLYDAPKVLLLLVPIVFAVGIVRSFFTAERSRAVLAGPKRHMKWPKVANGCLAQRVGPSHAKWRSDSG